MASDTTASFRDLVFLFREFPIRDFYHRHRRRVGARQINIVKFRADGRVTEVEGFATSAVITIRGERPCLGEAG